MGKEKNPRRVADNEAMAKLRMLRTSPQKLNLVAAMIRGKKVERALTDLTFSNKRIAVDVKKCLQSAIANAENGATKGREFEIADLLRFIKNAGIDNTVWLTADVHYTAAHYYDPSKAQFQDFEPFWEFVSGPIHAGTFGPNDLDMTFGPELKFVKAPTAEQGVNLPPSMGLQFFGLVEIDGESEAMTVRLMDADDQELWSTTLEPQSKA